ncbi:MAG: hypothetical protein JW885_02490 [Deltaproteobacteria bacterium]|nr:hypothetical protein [Candidatus Zymogenaceae bacterium]
MTRQETREFMTAARIFAAVLILAVKDYYAGTLEREWFFSERATLLMTVVIVAGLVNDVIAEIETIRAAA